MYINGMEVYGIVYKVRNKVNNKHYIGITTQDGGFNVRYNYGGTPIERIYKTHYQEKISGRHYNEYLLEDIEKYKFESFEVDTLFDFAFSKDELEEMEIRYIREYDSLVCRNGYNKTTGGGRGKSSNLTKQKNSIASTGSNNPRAQKIVCVNNGKLYDCIKDASDKYLVPRSTINSCCLGYCKRAGKIGGEHLVWAYEEDYLKFTEQDKKRIIDDAQIEYTKLLGQNPRAIKVNIYYRGKYLCTEETLIEASIVTGVHKDNIGDMCKIGKEQIHKPTGYSFNYYEDDDQQPFDYYIALEKLGRNVINIYKYGRYIKTTESLEEAGSFTGISNSCIKNIYLSYGKEKIHINSGYSFNIYSDDDKQSFDYLSNIRSQKNVKLINVYRYGEYITFVLSASQAEKFTGIDSSRIRKTLLKYGKEKLDENTGYSFHYYDSDNR